MQAPEDDKSQRAYLGFQPFILAFLCAVLISPVTFGQVPEGTITGSARGDAGSAIPGVQISIKDVATGQVRTEITDTSGTYSLPALPAGNYEMTVSAPGFLTQVLTGIAVTVGSERVLDILMRAGSSKSIVRTSVAGAPSNQSPGNINRRVTLTTPLWRIRRSMGGVGLSLLLYRQESPAFKLEAPAAVEIPNAALEHQ